MGLWRKPRIYPIWLLFCTKYPSKTHSWRFSQHYLGSKGHLWMFISTIVIFTGISMLESVMDSTPESTPCLQEVRTRSRSIPLDRGRITSYRYPPGPGSIGWHASHNLKGQNSLKSVILLPFGSQWGKWTNTTATIFDDISVVAI